ncbi:MBL fold metallo-hydrolase [Cellulomonas fengjieae]|uniref:MBL fold metallo-hydrolase n=1 Tax=Cellulomonas fengjieae TaxID=2819978 RepID=UPI001AAFBFF5|nr:MBL fold metallo-hydrolase [Cellulomonas fengjieae]MBO3103141.1 MBL fold metallo-hydrolase [Cellulomonas fengjieae]
MNLRVRWLGHASTVIDVDGVRLLTDPLLLRQAGLLRRRGAAPDAAHWQGADAVLLSHLHHDHAELGSLRLLEGVPVLSARTNARWLRSRGIGTATGLTELQWWQVPGSDVRVRMVPAVHIDRPMPYRPNATHGFLVVSGSFRIWFAGDTAPFAAMADIPVLAGGPIDLALVPVGGWGPRLSGGHMDPVQAARVCASVGVRAAVPVHWGTLHAPVSRHLPPGWMDRAGPAFAHAAARVAPGVRVHVVPVGEQIELTSTR